MYGDKRNYPKIDIFVGPVYACSTTWARTCEEAVQHFINYKQLAGPVTARRAK